MAAGAIARKLLSSRWGVEVVAFVSKVGRLVATAISSACRAPTWTRRRSAALMPAVAAEMIAAVEAARKEGNSLGGIVTCVARGCPPGWGEPVFDRLEADLAARDAEPAG